MVCEVTGFCIRKDNIVESVFRDEVVSFGGIQAYSGDMRKQDSYCEIEMFVKDLLVSENAIKVNVTERMNYALKISNTIQKKINLQNLKNESYDIIDLVVRSLDIHKEVKKYQIFDIESRKRLCQKCCEQLKITIPICNKYLNMNIKKCDMRTIVYGLIFLMRSGIFIHDICVLPVLSELTQCLPNESNLLKYFGFRSKNITDIENKFKFHLRGVKRSDMQNMGFHMIKIET